MATTKPVLSSSRSASASSERNVGHPSTQTVAEPKPEAGTARGLWMKRLLKPVSEHLAEKHSPAQGHQTTSDTTSEGQVPAMSMTSVLKSLSRINVFRERTKAMRGNITKDAPLRKFLPLTVKEEMDRILNTALKGVKYDPKRASVLATSLSDSIKGKVKTMKFPRYKFIVSVTISSRDDQAMTVASRCLWNASTDSFATSYFTNESIAVVATLFAILKE